MQTRYIGKLNFSPSPSENMTTHKKRTAALALLAQTGIWRSNYEPPLLRLLWRLGFDVPLPHMMSFWKNALSAGSYFGIAWGLIMWTQGTTGTGLLVGAVVAGLLFGIGMASYYAYGKRKYKLPSWQELDDLPGVTK